MLPSEMLLGCRLASNRSDHSVENARFCQRRRVLNTHTVGMRGSLPENPTFAGRFCSGLVTVVPDHAPGPSGSICPGAQVINVPVHVGRQVLYKTPQLRTRGFL